MATLAHVRPKKSTPVKLGRQTRLAVTLTTGIPKRTRARTRRRR